MATTKSKPQPKFDSLSIHREVADEFRKLAAGKFPRWSYSALLREMCATWRRKQLRNGQ